MERTRAWRWWARCVFTVLLGLAAVGGIAFGQGTGKKLPRPYPGFPPLIPHDVQALKGGQCLTCHGSGMGGAPIAPHPGRTHFCVQCHVGQDATVEPFGAAAGRAR